MQNCKIKKNKWNKHKKRWIGGGQVKLIIDSNIFKKGGCFEGKLATVVKSDPKAPFSIATTQRCKGGRYSFPWIAPLYPWYVPYNAKC